jgi:hypothetical protein
MLRAIAKEDSPLGKKVFVTLSLNIIIELNCVIPCHFNPWHLAALSEGV